jgi:hypothetical protein
LEGHIELPKQNAQLLFQKSKATEAGLIHLWKSALQPLEVCNAFLYGTAQGIKSVGRQDRSAHDLPTGVCLRTIKPLARHEDGQLLGIVRFARNLLR